MFVFLTSALVFYVYPNRSQGGGDEDPSPILDARDDFDDDDVVFDDSYNESVGALDLSVQSASVAAESVVTGTAINVDDTGVEGDEESEENRHMQLPNAMTGCNSPRKRPEVAKCWKIVKRLRTCEDAPDFANKWVQKGFTHVCVHNILADEWGGEFCNTPLKLHRLPGKDKKNLTWVTTHATNHISRYHKDHAVASEVEKRASVAHNERVSQMTGIKHEKGIVAVKVVANTNTIQKCVLSRK